MSVESLPGKSMIGLLFNWRIWAAVSIAVALAASHWKAYHAGGASAREELQAYQLEATQQAAAASEAARKKETALNLSLERVKASYEKTKRDNAALSSALDDSLRQFQSALSDRSLKNPIASIGANGAGGLERELLGHCAAALAELGQTSDRLENKVVGLQDYVRDVCLK